MKRKEMEKVSKKNWWEMRLHGREHNKDRNISSIYVCSVHNHKSVSIHNSLTQDKSYGDDTDLMLQ